MSLISLVLVLAIVGFLCWLILTFIPMPPPFKSIIIAVICIALVLWVLQSLGAGGLPRVRLN